METSASECITDDAGQAKALLEAAAIHVGREVCVTFCRAALREKDGDAAVSAPNQEESDDFYEFTEEDYARLLASKKPETFLRTKKIRDAEEAARRARLTKAIIRVQFPDNYIVEAKFQPSDSLLTLIDFLKKIISRVDVPFYLYTTPPKQRLQDTKKDLYTLGLVPGGLVHFSYDFSKGFSEEEQSRILSTSYLQIDVMALKDLHMLITPAIQIESLEKDHTTFTQQRSEQQSNKRPGKTGVKPKWLKL
ncbi:hypothetical protein L7F22_025405 [Adiantum nelumboides]|nr:hypothetical protein [Adiantum nelumboides]